jgi:crotonobetaine/carnitine-CoA ligase
LNEYDTVLKRNRPNLSVQDKFPDAPVWQRWENGWFHTGDMFVCDDQGYYYFVDRKKDAIRRRGENISSFEVERDVMAYPEVQEAAAIVVSRAS